MFQRILARNQKELYGNQTNEIDQATTDSYRQNGFIQKIQGIYIHTLLSNDILFIHHPNIQDEDRIIHLNLDQLEKKILEKSYMV